MTPPPSALSTAPKAASEADPGPASPKISSTPSYDRLEIRAGAHLGIPSSYALDVAAHYRPNSRFILGGGVQSDFHNRLSLFAEGGVRFRISRSVFIQPALLAGIGRYLGLQSQTGTLAVPVKFDSLYFLINPELRIGVRLNPRFALYAGLGYTFEKTQDTKALGRPETARGNFSIFGLSLGLLIGALSKKGEASKTKEPSIPPPAKANAESLPAPDPKTLAAGSEEKIQAQLAEIKKGLSDADAKKFEEGVEKVREQLGTLQRSLTRLSAGMNRTNQMVRKITELRYQILGNPRYRLHEKDPVWRELDALHRAVRLDSQDKPAFLTGADKEIRNGLRVLYPAQKNGKTYGERIAPVLERLASQLKAQGQKGSSERIARIAADLHAYLKKGASPIEIENFHRETTSLEKSLAQLEPLVGELKLTGNPNWRGLKSDLQLLKGRVGLKVGETYAFAKLVSILHGPENDFIRHVESPAKARSAFENGLRFLNEMPQISDYAEVRTDKLRKTYSDFFGLLELNLDTFVQRYTPPLLRRAHERRRWFPAVLEAKKLLCFVNSAQKTCSKNLAAPPGHAARWRPAQRVKAPAPALKLPAPPKKPSAPTPPPGPAGQPRFRPILPPLKLPDPPTAPATPGSTDKK